jgi:hypothetical protein
MSNKNMLQIVVRYLLWMAESTASFSRPWVPQVVVKRTTAVKTLCNRKLLLLQWEMPPCTFGVFGCSSAQHSICFVLEFIQPFLGKGLVFCLFLWQGWHGFWTSWCTAKRNQFRENRYFIGPVLAKIRLRIAALSCQLVSLISSLSVTLAGLFYF